MLLSYTFSVNVILDTSFNFKLIPDGITVTNNIPAKIKRMIYDHSNI